MLTQIDAEALIASIKRFASQKPIRVPPGADQSHELVSDDGREKFLLDVWRSTFRLSKVKYQTRGRKVVVLVRLDIDGAPHTNPDGTQLPGTHLHLYQEGYDAKWAYPLDSADFRSLASIAQTLTDFCKYCNIVDIPQIQEGLL